MAQPRAWHSPWHTAQPLAHGTAPGHRLGTGSWHKVAHKDGAMGSLGRDGLVPPHLQCTGACRTLPGELWRWGGLGPLGGMHPAGVTMAVPGRAPCSRAMPVPLPWSIPRWGKKRCCSPPLSHPAMPASGACPAVPPFCLPAGPTMPPGGRGVPGLPTPGRPGLRGRAGGGGLQAEGIGSDIPVAWRPPSLSAGSTFE